MMSGLSPSKITIFTSNNDPSKRLKRPTQILLTATLTDKGQKFDDQCPIVWQTLTFRGPEQELSSTWYTGIKLGNAPGTAPRVGRALDARVAASTDVKEGYVELTTAGREPWVAHPFFGGGSKMIAINNSSTAQNFLLGFTGNTGAFEPLYLLKNLEIKAGLAFDATLTLQAYAIASTPATPTIPRGYLIEKNLSQSIAKFLPDANPSLLDVLKRETRWRLYSGPGDSVVLELEGPTLPPKGPVPETPGPKEPAPAPKPEPKPEPEILMDTDSSTEEDDPPSDLEKVLRRAADLIKEQRTHPKGKFNIWEKRMLQVAGNSLRSELLKFIDTVKKLEGYGQEEEID